MATTAPLHGEPSSTNEAVDELYLLIEDAFDREGLSEEQRDERYATLKGHLDAKDVEPARS